MSRRRKAVYDVLKGGPNRFNMVEDSFPTEDEAREFIREQLPELPCSLFLVLLDPKGRELGRYNGSI